MGYFAYGYEVKRTILNVEYGSATPIPLVAVMLPLARVMVKTRIMDKREDEFFVA